jgi:hypothetical protein
VEWRPDDFDVVVAIFMQFAGLAQQNVRRFHSCLKPGGLLIMQGYRVEQFHYGTGGPPNVENLYTKDLLIRAFGHWEIRHLREHDSVLSEGAGTPACRRSSTWSPRSRGARRFRSPCSTQLWQTNAPLRSRQRAPVAGRISHAEYEVRAREGNID